MTDRFLIPGESNVSGYVCACCRIGFEGLVRWNHERRVCETCGGHRNAGSMQKENEHATAWSAWRNAMLRRIEAEQKRHTASVVALEAQVDAGVIEASDLRSALANGIDSMPANVIASYFETDAVRSANGARDSAFRRRDEAMGHLWMIDKRHHAKDTRTSACSCNNSRCDIPRVLEPILNDLNKWEKSQVDRAEQGKINGLPKEHPKYNRSYAA